MWRCDISQIDCPVTVCVLFTLTMLFVMPGHIGDLSIDTCLSVCLSVCLSAFLCAAYLYAVIIFTDTDNFSARWCRKCQKFSVV